METKKQVTAYSNTLSTEVIRLNRVIKQICSWDTLHWLLESGAQAHRCVEVTK